MSHYRFSFLDTWKRDSSICSKKMWVLILMPIRLLHFWQARHFVVEISWHKRLINFSSLPLRAWCGNVTCSTEQDWTQLLLTRGVFNNDKYQGGHHQSLKAKIFFLDQRGETALHKLLFKSLLLEMTKCYKHVIRLKRSPAELLFKINIFLKNVEYQNYFLIKHLWCQIKLSDSRKFQALSFL